MDPIHKYLITESIPWESERTWSVFAKTSDDAIFLVSEYENKDVDKYYMSSYMTKSNIRGTNKCFVIKSNNNQYE